MASNQGLSPKDYNWINSKCRAIATMEEHGFSERDLRNELYVLGVFAFRHFHNAGMPMNLLHPSLNDQTESLEMVASNQT